jgi:hypothetical protein
MKKNIVLICAIGVIGALAYWFFLKPRELESEKNPVNSSSTVVTPNKNTKTQPAFQNKSNVSSQISVVNLSPEALSEVKIKASVMQEQLNNLTAELNKNLENTKERKIIQEKYAVLTQEYNKLVIQIVKAEAQSREAVAE